MQAAPVITIDGPSGTGKGTLAARLARALGWHVLDSGALYRALALKVLAEGVDDRDDTTLARLAAALDVTCIPGDDGIEVQLDGRPAGRALRDEAVAAAASRLAARPAVRAALLERQRAFRRPPGLVADGRDMGTVVFPDAALKVFLTATAAVRAERRYKQLKQKGIDANLPELVADIAERDRRDRERPVSPLKPAPDAVELDTSQLDAEQVFRRVVGLARARGLMSAVEGGPGGPGRSS